MGRIAQSGPVAHVPQQNMDIVRAMQDMKGLPQPIPQSTSFIDPNLLSDVCIFCSLSRFSILAICMRAELQG